MQYRCIDTLAWKQPDCDMLLSPLALKKVQHALRFQGLHHSTIHKMIKCCCLTLLQDTHLDCSGTRFSLYMCHLCMRAMLKFLVSFQFSTGVKAEAQHIVYYARVLAAIWACSSCAQDDL